MRCERVRTLHHASSMRDLTKRGRKRQQPLDAERMTNVTARLPAWLVLRLDEEAVRLARETGIATINRSDIMRRLLAAALQAIATGADIRRR